MDSLKFLTRIASKLFVGKNRNFIFPLFILIAFLIKPAATNAQAGAALNFDGINDRVVVTNSQVNLSNKSFSVEMWLKRFTTNTYDIAFGQGESGGIPANNTALHIGFDPGGNFIFNFYIKTR